MPTRNIFIILACLIVSAICYSEFHKNRYADTVAEAMTIIETQALKELTRRELFRAAMRGMVAQIDEHSAFYDMQETNEFRESLEQEFGGIGVIVENHPENGLTVVTPLPDTPAAEAGMLPGDVIVSVNGEPTTNLTRDNAIRMIKGPTGEPVRISFRHRGQSETITADIVRATVEIASVEGDYRNESLNWTFRLEDHPDIGYIRLSTFGEKSVEEMKEALASINGQVKGLILDLRDNPGGLLDTATILADMFLPPGKLVVETRRRNGLVEQEYFSKAPADFPTDVPMVVLVNGRSASASEILAACLQDHNRAIVCGQRSWGKGTVQNAIAMENRKSTLKITTASYWRPSEKNIHRHEGATEDDQWGVLPNPGFEVKLERDEEFEVLRYRNFRDRKNIGGQVDQELELTVDRQLKKAVEYLVELKN